MLDRGEIKHFLYVVVWDLIVRSTCGTIVYGVSDDFSYVVDLFEGGT